MSDHFDVITLGMGPGGEVAASRFLAAVRRVAVIERELIGGEFAYWGSIPSKKLRRPPDAQPGFAGHYRWVAGWVGRLHPRRPGRR